MALLENWTFGWVEIYLLVASTKLGLILSEAREQASFLLNTIALERFEVNETVLPEFFFSRLNTHGCLNCVSSHMVSRTIIRSVSLIASHFEHSSPRMALDHSTEHPLTSEQSHPFPAMKASRIRNQYSWVPRGSRAFGWIYFWLEEGSKKKKKNELDVCGWEEMIKANVFFWMLITYQTLCLKLKRNSLIQSIQPLLLVVLLWWPFHSWRNWGLEKLRISPGYVVYAKTQARY